MHWFDGGSMFWGGWWMLFFWLGVGVLFVWGFRQAWDGDRARSHDQPEAPALEIARQRYARGEISRDEYLTLIDDLNDGAAKAKRGGD